MSAPQPGEQRVYFCPSHRMQHPYFGVGDLLQIESCLLRIDPSQPQFYAVRDPDGAFGYCAADELLDPNDARGWPALPEE